MELRLNVGIHEGRGTTLLMPNSTSARSVVKTSLCPSGSLLPHLKNEEVKSKL